jgi:hypothetical protein
MMFHIKRMQDNFFINYYLTRANLVAKQIQPVLEKAMHTNIRNTPIEIVYSILQELELYAPSFLYVDNILLEISSNADDLLKNKPKKKNKQAQYLLVKKEFAAQIHKYRSYYREYYFSTNAGNSTLTS